MAETINPTARRVLSLALALLGAGLVCYGFVGLYNAPFRARRWSGFEVALGAALMIWGALFLRHNAKIWVSQPDATGLALDIIEPWQKGYDRRAREKHGKRGDRFRD